MAELPPIGPKYSPEEFARRAAEIFEQRVARHVQSEHPRKFVAIDIETGNWEIDEDERTAVDRLWAQNPNAQPFVRRVGSPSARTFGWRPLARA